MRDPDIETLKLKTFVYEGTEVVMTGRTASKPSNLNKSITIMMYEIKPQDSECLTWKKWVKLEELFTID